MLALTCLGASSDGDIVLEVTGLDHQSGTVRCGLYQEESWLEPPDAVRWVDAEYRDGKAYCTFDDIEPGEYAIGSFHDADNDHEMATNVVGIPTEGVCASNDPEGGMGPPDYDGAKFEHGRGETHVSCTMRY